MQNPALFVKIRTMDDLKEKTSKVLGGTKGAHTAKKNPAKQKKTKRVLICLICVVVVLAAGYLTAVYSNIPFIANLRTLYIETAMNTLHHQWLATAFIPGDVIDKVMADIQEEMDKNKIDQSDLPPGPPDTTAPTQPVGPDTADTTDTTPQTEPPPPPPPTPLDLLTAMFPQIDTSTLPADLPLENIQRKDIASLGIKTTAGDTVWAIDMPNQILIMEVKGDNYVGKLALCKGSSRTILGKDTRFSSRGETVVEFCEDYDAILGINAGGFEDEDGKGRGTVAVGLVKSQGELVSKATKKSPFQIAGFDQDDNFRVGTEVDVESLRDGMQFFPVLVANGEKRVGKGSSGMGIQPRSCIGQTSTKDTLMLIIDGRQPGYSIGTTVSECADILLRYDCFTAMTNDGGSSAIMVYDGEPITKNSAHNMPTGRYFPCGWVVLKPSGGAVEDTTAADPTGSDTSTAN